MTNHFISLLQILTGSADGSIHALYSPLTSLKGVTTALSRTPRARAIDDYSSFTAIDRPIIAPHSLPMYKEEMGAGMVGSGKRKRERERHDSVKTMKPSEFSFLFFSFFFCFFFCDD